MADWARLEDAYGRASEVPAILADLSHTSAKKRASARDRFRAHLVHQGSVYEATVAAIPVVVALVQKKMTPDKGELLCLLEEAAIGEHTNFLHGRFEAREGGRSVEARCYTLVAKAAATYAALLDVRDSSTRAGAAFVLGWLPSRAKTSLPKIRARLRVEKDNDVRAGLLLALGMLGTDADAATLEAACTSRARGGHPSRPGRSSALAAAAIARVWLNRKTAPADLRAVLEFCAADSVLRRTSIPWNWGDLAGLAQTVIGLLPSGKPRVKKKASAPEPENPRELRIKLGKNKPVYVHWKSVVSGRVRPVAFAKACSVLGVERMVAATIASVGQFALAQHDTSVEMAIRLLEPIAKKNPAALLAVAKRFTKSADFLMAKVLVVLLERTKQAPQLASCFRRKSFPPNE